MFDVIQKVVFWTFTLAVLLATLGAAGLWSVDHFGQRELLTESQRFLCLLVGIPWIAAGAVVLSVAGIFAAALAVVF